ncbi:MAG: VOC family protein [Polyangiales bacterium]
MENENPSILSHVSIGSSDMPRSVAFYDAVLPVLGCKKLMEYPFAVAYGKQFPEFWVQTPIDGQPASVGNGTHCCFLAESKEAVHAFHEAALAAGATDDGPPGPRPQYSPGYYGAFARDPDGHKVEATYFDASLGEHA